MRQVVTPMRNMMARDSDTIAALPGLQSDDRLYFRDVYDSLVRTSELVDSYRDLLSGATDMYLSTVANRQGEVNKQLTIIATIFLPLTFLTGFFGQNFSLPGRPHPQRAMGVPGLRHRRTGALGDRLLDLLPAQALDLKERRSAEPAVGAHPVVGDGQLRGGQAHLAVADAGVQTILE